METKTYVKHAGKCGETLIKGINGWLIGKQDAPQPMTYAEAKAFCARQKCEKEPCRFGDIGVWTSICAETKEYIDKKLAENGAAPLRDGMYWIEGDDAYCVADVNCGNIIGNVNPEAKCWVRLMIRLEETPQKDVK